MLGNGHKSEGRQWSISLLQRLQGYLLVILFCCCIPFTTLYSATVPPDKDYFDIVKSIDLFGEVYREVSKSYVDTLNVSKLMYAGIDGMLHTLDPYTVFLDEADSGELDELTSGQYAGIGVTIASINGMCFVTSVVEGCAAAKAGIKVGDKIVTINNTEVMKSSFDEVRLLMKGAVGTSLTLRIERKGSTIFIAKLIREEVRVSSVSYSGISNGIGYFEMKSFGSRSADDLREAFQGLQRQSRDQHLPLKGIILDLRNNPGGLLTVAVDVVSLFVNKGSEVVSIRGRAQGTSKSYGTASLPIDAAIPLAVLINTESASASEIVSGAIQDLDRGVIIGERSYGKGLVQSVIPLAYDNTLKLTTAKYYTPSGRLIQKEKDAEHDARKVLSKTKGDDAAKVFYTKRKRKVYGNGGITPDIHLSEKSESPYIAELRKKGMLFLFANTYCSSFNALPPQPFDRKVIMASFGEFLHNRQFIYTSEAERRLSELKESMKKASKDKNGEWVKTFGILQQDVDKLKAEEITKEYDKVADVLEQEIMRHFSERLARHAELEHDPVFKKAQEVLSDSRKYSGILHP
ncbi:MAG: S41 family peptidase [Chlorobiales bacterium]|nr:S41 family peptidase [Chlorobiales bacterium]